MPCFETVHRWLLSFFRPKAPEIKISVFQEMREALKPATAAGEPAKVPPTPPDTPGTR
jgi:hypothetical protein